MVHNLQQWIRQDTSLVATAVRAMIVVALAYSWNCSAQTPAQAPDAAKVQDTRDKINKLNETVNNSTSALDRASTYAAKLNAFTDPSSEEGDVLTRAQSIDEGLRTIATSNLQKELSDRKSSVDNASNTLTSAGCDKVMLGDDVAAQCTKAIANGQTRSSDLDTTKTRLSDALNGVGPYFKVSVADPSKQLDQIDTLWSAPNDLTAEDFASSVPMYKTSCSVSIKATRLKSDIYSSLKTLSADTTTEADVGSALTSLSERLKTEAKKVDAILTTIQKTADDQTKTVSDSLAAVAATPIASAQAASDAATKASRTVRGIVTIVSAWGDLDGSVKSCENDPTHLAKLRAGLKAVQDSKATLQEKLSILNDALVGDPNQFTEEAVPLFFYTEVEKLMRSLNERTEWAGGNGAAATEATSQRELLLTSESRVEQARGDVADLQFELAKLQEQQRQADAATSLLGLQSQNASRIKKARDSDLLHTTEEFNRAQAESDADPTKVAKKARLQKATEKKNTATTNANDATTKDSSARTKYADAQNQQTAASADKDSLAARIDLPTIKLKDAQRNMEEMQRNAYRAALTESDAFAAARDQTPYLEGPALSTSPDPVKRVIMRGYPDRNLILLRGKPDDIAVVKRIVAAFDVPAPQARLTLWSFQISAESGKGLLWFKKPADRLNEATAIVDLSLSKTRVKIAGATMNLRESVNEAVSAAETQTTGSANSCTQLEMPDVVRNQLLPSQQARWRRFRFYSPEVLIQAGVNMASPYSFKNAVLPDPAATTTVGEALMVLALSCRANREDVFAKFRDLTPRPKFKLGKYDLESMLFKSVDEDSLKEHPCFSGIAQILQVHTPCATKQYQSSTEENRLAQREKALAEQQAQFENERRKFEADKSIAKQECTNKLKDCQDALKQVSREPPSTEPCPSPIVDADFGSVDLGQSFAPSVSSEGITDTQLEIVHALRAGATKKIVDEMKNLLNLISKLEQEYHGLKSSRSYPNLSSTDVRACRIKSAEIQSLYDRYNFIVNRRLGALYPDQYLNFQLVPGRGDFRGRVKMELGTLQKPEQAAPRVAAADEMLKRMSSRIEDDLDKEYIQPMLKSVRTALVKQGLTVGIVERTSVLATNRLKARVDPKGTYDLSVGEQQDLLASVGQLTSIYMSAQTGGALAAFGSMNSLNQKQEQHIYGVTTGNKFEVTPIFDPSGQALRFKFDYVSNSLVRNPRGTVDPSMPSLRHTINTEVQLSNLEIREVSRYESNAKLGIPTRYFGGIPILTDIPGLKPIPIIGWFVRRGGSNAEVQQSVIFGQTTIYPTIGSIVELLQTGD